MSQELFTYGTWCHSTIFTLSLSLKFFPRYADETYKGFVATLVSAWTSYSVLGAILKVPGKGAYRGRSIEGTHAGAWDSYQRVPL